MTGKWNGDINDAIRRAKGGGRPALYVVPSPESDRQAIVDLGHQVTELMAKVNANAADCTSGFLAVENALRRLVDRIDALEAATRRYDAEGRPRAFTSD